MIMIAITIYSKQPYHLLQNLEHLVLKLSDFWGALENLIGDDVAAIVARISHCLTLLPSCNDVDLN